jgi:hypothetical protein
MGCPHLLPSLRRHHEFNVLDWLRAEFFAFLDYAGRLVEFSGKFLECGLEFVRLDGRYGESIINDRGRRARFCVFVERERRAGQRD